jgi:hypothetical protein
MLHKITPYQYLPRINLLVKLPDQDQDQDEIVSFSEIADIIADQYDEALTGTCKN